MLIHFICTGNAYRSRLAEAYLNSKKIIGIKAISSGIRALEDRHGNIRWYAQRIIELDNLVDYSKLIWQQTTVELLKKSDVVVFMTKSNFDRCINFLRYIPNNYEVWNVPDLDELGYITERNSYEDEMEKIRITDLTYLKIKAKVDNLIFRIKKGDFPLLTTAKK